jgi:hypothetical protein
MRKATTKMQQQQVFFSEKIKRPTPISADTLRRSTRDCTPSEAALNQIVNEYDLQQRRATAKRTDPRDTVVPSFSTQATWCCNV